MAQPRPPHVPSLIERDRRLCGERKGFGGRKMDMTSQSAFPPLLCSKGHFTLSLPDPGPTAQGASSHPWTGPQRIDLVTPPSPRLVMYNK